jgi:polyphosphate glucokinase
MAERILGIDVGGSSIKSALVDVESGKLLATPFSVPTPKPATPPQLLDVFADVVRHFAPVDAIGLAMPSVVQHGVTRTAANIDAGWLGFPIERELHERTRQPVKVLNDADAAGLAEMRWGSGRDTAGLVIMLTFGTGIGSAIFINGQLVPNTEFGHLEMLGRDAELHASARVRTAEGLDWPQWAERVNLYLAKMHALFWPDVFILGGAVSENYALFAPHLRSQAEVRPALFAGHAGIVGAALAAQLAR